MTLRKAKIREAQESSNSRQSESSNGKFKELGILFAVLFAIIIIFAIFLHHLHGENQQLRKKIERIEEELIINKQALSYVFDKLKEIPKVSFKSGTCDVHGTKLPIPDGFEKEDCTFFTAGHGNFYGGNTGDVIPVFTANDHMVLPYQNNGGWKGGGYVIGAVKQSTTDEEVENKKREYGLQ
eukprot:c16963_g1_i2.p1 GENE.c16963_g1_i2~~c16963_g1_i2.p1  ORF type:complete len:182 (+),score=13.30 c16963_g1_i2:80-625(+)